MKRSLAVTLAILLGAGTQLREAPRSKPRTVAPATLAPMTPRAAERAVVAAPAPASSAAPVEPSSELAQARELIACAARGDVGSLEAVLVSAPDSALAPLACELLAESARGRERLFTIIELADRESGALATAALGSLAQRDPDLARELVRRAAITTSAPAALAFAAAALPATRGDARLRRDLAAIASARGLEGEPLWLGWRTLEGAMTPEGAR